MFHSQSFQERELKLRTEIEVCFPWSISWFTMSIKSGSAISFVHIAALSGCRAAYALDILHEMRFNILACMSAHTFHTAPSSPVQQACYAYEVVLSGAKSTLFMLIACKGSQDNRNKSDIHAETNSKRTNQREGEEGERNHAVWRTLLASTHRDPCRLYEKSDKDECAGDHGFTSSGRGTGS
jgi:hypothetical protein